MKKISLIILMIIFLIGCQTDDVIKIGVVGTMSGSNSDLSVSGRRGIELAVDEINSSGGINGKTIELMVKDDLNDASRATEIVKEFEAENVEIVIGPFTSSMMFSAYDTVIESDLLYISPTVSADSLNDIDDNFLRVTASTKAQAVALGKLSTQLGLKDFLVITDDKNDQFTTPLSNNFENELSKFGGKVILKQGFNELDDVSLAVLIDKITSLESYLDGVFVIASAVDLAMIEQALHVANIDVVVYGPLWAHTTDLLRRGGLSIENDYIVSGITFGETTEAFDVFQMKYKETFGEDLTFSALYAYETMKVLEQAMGMSESFNWQIIKNNIIEIGLFEGLQGEFELNQFGDSTRAYKVDKIIDGEFVGDYEN